MNGGVFSCPAGGGGRLGMGAEYGRGGRVCGLSAGTGESNSPTAIEVRRRRTQTFLLSKSLASRRERQEWWTPPAHRAVSRIRTERAGSNDSTQSRLGNQMLVDNW